MAQEGYGWQLLSVFSHLQGGKGNAWQLPSILSRHKIGKIDV
jgi:hypothetical protein